MKRTIFLIGGGTGGHIVPLGAVARELEKGDEGVRLVLVTASAELDKQYYEQNFSTNVEHRMIQTGKIRSYWSWGNVWAPLRVLRAVGQAWWWLWRERPMAVLHKGGYVCLPFVLGWWLLPPGRRPRVYLHESDCTTSGMSRLIERQATRVFRTFTEESPTPLFRTYARTVTVADAAPTKPKLLVMGSSLGAQYLNEVVAESLSTLCERYAVALVTGKGKHIAVEYDDFMQYETLPHEDLYKKIDQSDVIVSRASAGSISEILHLRKRALFIPLPIAARDHQTKNAQWLAERGLAHWCAQGELTAENIMQRLEALEKDESLGKKIVQFVWEPAADTIAGELLRGVHKLKT